MTQTRIIFFAGKGGVGKTTHAATTALACSDLGLPSLLVSTDPAHSLSDLLQIEHANEVTKLGQYLDVLEVDPYHELQSNWSNIRDYLSSLLVSLGAEETLASELAIIPGMDNMFSLLRLQDFYESGKYAVILVDMAPTGDSLRLLSLPQMISSALKITRYLEKYLISPVVRPASRVSKSLSKVIAPADVAKAWEQILERLMIVRDILDNRASASVRLVMTPERIVLNESQRALTYLSLFGLTTDLIIVNRLLPEDSYSAFTQTWYENQQMLLENIRTAFHPIPIRTAELSAFEIVGLENLRRYSRDMYPIEDPSKLLYMKKPVQVGSDRKARRFSVAMPFVDPGKCRLMTRSNELLISYGSQLRSFVLPDSFVGLEPSEAAYSNGYLEVSFRKTSV